MENKGLYFEAIGAIYSIFGIIIWDKLYKDSAGLSEGDSASNAKLKKVLSYMRSSYDTQISLEQMANVAGIVFGYLHVADASGLLQFLYIIPYSSLGVAFAVMYNKTNTVFTSISMHMFHNLALTILSIIA